MIRIKVRELKETGCAALGREVNGCAFLTGASLVWRLHADHPGTGPELSQRLSQGLQVTSARAHTVEQQQQFTVTGWGGVCRVGLLDQQVLLHAMCPQWT